MDVDENTSSDPIVSSNQTDFEQIWLSIATDIIIRKFENLDDILEFHQLSDHLQNELKDTVISLNNNYKIFYDEQELKNFHVILYFKDKEKYLAIFEEQTQSQQIRTIINSMGLMSFYQYLSKFISKDSEQRQTLDNDHEEQSQPIEQNNSNNTESSSCSKFFGKVPNINIRQYIPTFSRESSSTSTSSYNKLVENCMLRKLEGISNTK
ncbi:unnamed protein product [Adineta ricciae]|uniref:Uncharacterized protein n=1 Tax=Adineta ricciae TaxID=249248 RepID=A0A815NJ80_ADIRI|nr:unnamed protein product [Adineta ricciae]CAF1676221.1 unnamed protein product [Adineta ricciae]